MAHKIFALAGSITVGTLAGTVAAAGCSSTEIITEVIGDGGAADAGSANDAGDHADALIEERTVGKPCSTSNDCLTDGSIGDNFCSSAGGPSGAEILSTPVCVSACTAPTPSSKPTMLAAELAKYLCDGEVGFCVGSPGAQGLCLGKCKFTSTSIIEPCAGNNRCVMVLTGASSPSYGIGFCAPGCNEDEDCKGTGGRKCDKNTGNCLTRLPDSNTKSPGEACKNPASSSEKAECPCSVVGGTGPTKDKGFCTRECTTVAAFDEPDAGGGEVDAAAPLPDACDAWLKGWRCTALLSTQTTLNGKVYRLFTGQPPGIQGECRRPCSKTEDCADLAAATGANVECTEFAGPGGNPASFCSMAP